MRNPILITGCARSGTSLTAGIIDICGAFGGVTGKGGTRYNKKGMFENGIIRNGILKPYLRSIQCDPKGQYPLPDISKLQCPPNWTERIEGVFKDQGYKEGHWYYKDAKMCLMWNVWHEAFSNAKWIIVRRNRKDIVNSCLKTAFMNAFHSSAARAAVGAATKQDGWNWWIDQHEKRFQEMKDAGLNVREVWPEKMVEGDYSEVYKMLEWLGLSWNGKIVNFVEPKLWKNKRR
jgi:hypothetical protein